MSRDGRKRPGGDKPIRRGARNTAKKEPGHDTAQITSVVASRQGSQQQGPHAKISVVPHYEYASAPVDDPPVMGVLVELRAEGRAIVDRRAGPVSHVILCLDLSASMDHPDKFPVLQAAIASMLDDLRNPRAAEVLISVVVFSKGADVLMKAVPAHKVKKADLFRALVRNRLTFGRYTDVAGALKHACVIAAEQVRANRTLPVRIYLLTDGKPQDVNRARMMADKVATVPADLHALAFGADADVMLLQELFAGRRGGTVKSVRATTIGSAFERVAVTSQRVVATRCRLTVELAAGVVGGEAYRYRPARVRFPSPTFKKGKTFRTDLGTIESGRTYSVLFEVRPPETVDTVTKLGKVKIEIPGYGGPITVVKELELKRTAVGTELGEIHTGVRTARDILDAISDADPEKALRALKLRRTLYEVEKRDPGLLAILDKAIAIMATTGSLDSLSKGDQATLMSHTCTGSGEDWEELVGEAV